MSLEISLANEQTSHNRAVIGKTFGYFFVISVFKEKALRRVNAELIARKRECNRAAAAVTVLKVNAVSAFSVLFAQSAERCTNFVKVFPARKKFAERRFLYISEKIFMLLVIARHLMAR